MIFMSPPPPPPPPSSSSSSSKFGNELCVMWRDWLDGGGGVILLPLLSRLFLPPLHPSYTTIPHPTKLSRAFAQQRTTRPPKKRFRPYVATLPRPWTTHSCTHALEKELFKLWSLPVSKTNFRRANNCASSSSFHSLTQRRRRRRPKVVRGKEEGGGRRNQISPTRLLPNGPWQLIVFPSLPSPRLQICRSTCLPLRVSKCGSGREVEIFATVHVVGMDLDACPTRYQSEIYWMARPLKN